MYSRSSLDIPEEQQVNLFIQNLVLEMMYELKLKSPSTIEKLIKKGMNIETALMAKGIIKLNKDSDNTNNLGDKNKNVTNDGVVDARAVNANQPPFTIKKLSAPNMSTMEQNQTPTSNVTQQPPYQQYTQQYNQQQGQQQNQQRKPFRSRDGPPQQFMPLGEPIESVMKQLIQAKFIKLPDIKVEPLVKPLGGMIMHIVSTINQKDIKPHHVFN